MNDCFFKLIQEEKRVVKGVNFYEKRETYRERREFWRETQEEVVERRTRRLEEIHLF